VTGAVTLAEARQRGQRMLDPVSVSAAVDADWLLGAATGQSAAQRRAHPEQPLAEPAWRRYQGLLQRRYRGEPVAYLLGRCGFMDFELVVTPAVLIPRPETEHLVEAALEQGPAVREYLAAQGFEAIETRRDLAGHERISGGRRGAQRHE